MCAEFIWTSSHPDCRIPLTVRVLAGCQFVITWMTLLVDIIRNQGERVLTPQEPDMMVSPKSWNQTSPSLRATSRFSLHYLQWLSSIPWRDQERSDNTGRGLRRERISPITRNHKAWSPLFGMGQEGSMTNFSQRYDSSWGKHGGEWDA